MEHSKMIFAFLFGFFVMGGLALVMYRQICSHWKTVMLDELRSTFKNKSIEVVQGVCDLFIKHLSECDKMPNVLKHASEMRANIWELSTGLSQPIDVLRYVEVKIEELIVGINCCGTYHLVFNESLQNIMRSIRGQMAPVSRRIDEVNKLNSLENIMKGLYFRRQVVGFDGCILATFANDLEKFFPVQPSKNPAKTLVCEDCCH